jgi:GNAT superfamily N-acetyltransferase
VGALLDRAARATPPAVEDHSSGWWLRHTEGNAWWSGSVIAHGAPSDDRFAERLVERIVEAERFYARHHASARFQVCPACPADLDPLLGGRGYRRESPISLQTLEVPAVLDEFAVPGLDVHVRTAPDPGWLAVLTTTGGPRTVVENETRLLRRVTLPSAYVTVSAEHGPLAIGRAVADDGWTGVFNMATVTGARRRGAGRLVLATIARWAGGQGRPRLYLQVERSNDAACRLYAAAGFTEVATYHYRVRT